VQEPQMVILSTDISGNNNSNYTSDFLGCSVKGNILAFELFFQDWF